MIAPGVWVDEGESSVSPRFGVVFFAGTLVGSDRPTTLTSGERSIEAAIGRRLCGALMKVAKTTCARLAGHSGDHWSAASVQNKRARRAPHKSRALPRCEQPLRSDDVCGRFANHAGAHMGRRAMARDAEARRTRAA